MQTAFTLGEDVLQIQDGGPDVSVFLLDLLDVDLAQLVEGIQVRWVDYKKLLLMRQDILDQLRTLLQINQIPICNKLDPMFNI